jgi:multidrug efflux pump subunit AcrB
VVGAQLVILAVLSPVPEREETEVAKIERPSLGRKTNMFWVTLLLCLEVGMPVRIVLVALLVLNPLLWASPAGAGQTTILTVTVWYPGASPSNIDSQIATPVARLLGQIPGLTQMEFESSAGLCSARIVFGPDTAEDQVLTAVQKQLNAAGPSLPQDCLAPTWERGDRHQVAQFWISVTGEKATLAEISQAAGQIRDELAQLSGTTASRLIGATRPRSTLWLDPHKLSALGVTAGEAIHAIDNGERPEAGREGEAPKLEDFKIGIRNDVPIRLKDVGRVEEQPDPTGGFATADGAATVLVALSTRRRSITAVRLQEELVRLGPTLPPAMRATLAVDLWDPGFVLIDVALPHGASAGQTRRLAGQVSDAVREIDAHTKCLVFATADDTALRVLVGSRDHPADLARLRSRLSQVKDTTVRLCPIGFTGSLTPFPVRVALGGLDRAGLRRWGDAVRARLMRENTVIDPDLFPGPGVPQPMVKLNDATASRMGVPRTDLDQIVVLASGRVVRLYPRWTGALEIRLERKGDANPLADIDVRADDGKTVPLAAVAKVTVEEQPTALLTLGQFPAVRISASAPASVTTASAAARCIAAAKAEQEALKLSKDEYQVIDLTETAP